MPIDRGMDKEDVAHIHNRILLSHIKGTKLVICRDVDVRRDSYRGKSERVKPILYINAYMWNLKKIGIDDLIYKAVIETQT